MSNNKKKLIVLLVLLIVGTIFVKIVRMKNAQMEVHNEYQDTIIQIHDIIEDVLSDVLKVRQRGLEYNGSGNDFVDALKQFEHDVWGILYVTSNPVDEYSEQMRVIFFNELYPLTLFLSSGSSTLYENGKMDDVYVNIVYDLLEDIEDAFDIEMEAQSVEILDDQIENLHLVLNEATLKIEKIWHKQKNSSSR